ncbi:hypothetical protein FRC11_008934 [Ceratobasidium sp. 423]|nr:hypothetical protein FRC11_008934 [Ceratobasidium sp. 423]
MPYPQKQRLLHDYLSLQLRMYVTAGITTTTEFSTEWQGGSSHVPYGLIKAEHMHGEHTIVTQDVLPDGVEYLRNPMCMSENEVSAMINHLIAGDREELLEGREFQFNRWAKDRLESESLELGTWNASMVYGPESLAFVKAMEAAESKRQSSIPQGLKSISVSGVPYQSFNEAAIVTYSKTIADSDIWWSLQLALSEHDQANPMPATVEFWHERVAGMPHLKAEPPLPQSAGNHVVSEQGYLPVAWFDQADPGHVRSSLPATLDWCHPAHWLHAESGTLLGGYLGIKWPTAILGHLRRNVKCWTSEKSRERWLKHYAALRSNVESDIVFEFTNSQVQQIDAAIEALRNAIGDSTTRLREAQEARRPVPLDEIVMRASLSSHLNFPTTAAQFQTRTCRTSLMEWQPNDTYSISLGDPSSLQDAIEEEAGESSSVQGQQAQNAAVPTGDSISHQGRPPKRPAPSGLTSVSPRRRKTRGPSAERRSADVKIPDKGKNVAGPSRNTRSGVKALGKESPKKQKVFVELPPPKSS